MNAEVWKDIPGYEGMYQVSDHGGVLSLRFGKTKRLYQSTNSWGYKEVALCVGGKTKRYGVHRLVMLAFVGPSKLQVNHKNGIKHDNSTGNLEYCTPSENVRHSIYVLGNKPGFSKEPQRPWKGKFGKDNPGSKKVFQFKTDGTLVKVWDSVSDVFREGWTNHGSLTACCRGERKKHKGFIWSYNNVCPTTQRIG